MNNKNWEPKPDMPLKPIQHILDKLSFEDACDVIDFFVDFFDKKNNVDEDEYINPTKELIDSLGTQGAHVVNHMNKIGSKDVFDEIYPEKERTQLDKDIEEMFGYKPVDRPKTE